MSYNLTYFRAFTSFCTTTNNPPGAKEAWLNTVVAHTQPDILVCNEVDGSNATAHGRILNFSLNANGTTRWAATDLYTNGSSLINAVYYDQNKLGLKSQSIISNDLQNNTRWGATVAYSVDRQNSIKGYYSSGVSARTGNNYDGIGVAWQYRWGGGL